MNQGWEFAHRFFERIALFLKSHVSKSLTVVFLLWATWANPSGRSFVKSDESESLRSLFKKKRISEERHERFALGHKKGKNWKEHTKTTIFLVNRSFLRAIRSDHSHRSFFKSDNSDFLTSHFIMSDFEQKSECSNSQPCHESIHRHHWFFSQVSFSFKTFRNDSYLDKSSSLMNLIQESPTPWWVLSI